MLKNDYKTFEKHLKLKKNIDLNDLNILFKNIKKNKLKENIDSIYSSLTSRTSPFIKIQTDGKQKVEKVEKQEGGKYKQKYLKYKIKYEQLKNNKI